MRARTAPRRPAPPGPAVPTARLARGRTGRRAGTRCAPAAGRAVAPGSQRPGPGPRPRAPGRPRRPARPGAPAAPGRPARDPGWSRPVRYVLWLDRDQGEVEPGGRADRRRDRRPGGDRGRLAHAAQAVGGVRVGVLEHLDP